MSRRHYEIGDRIYNEHLNQYFVIKAFKMYSQCLCVDVVCEDGGEVYTAFPLYQFTYAPLIRRRWWEFWK